MLLYFTGLLRGMSTAIFLGDSTMLSYLFQTGTDISLGRVWEKLLALIKSGCGSEIRVMPASFPKTDPYSN